MKKLLRKARLPALATLCGAVLALAAVGLAAPLSLAGGARARAAADLFRKDLETYRAAPVDDRSAPLVISAAAAYEDRGLLRRPAWLPPISPQGTARAVWRNLRGIPEGGSTIPQQLAKLYLREGRRGTLLDKLDEALFATWLSRQAPPREIAGVYLNLSASAALGPDRHPADGLQRLSLALFGLPLRRLSREDQLVLGAIPRGVQWLRAHPALSARRVASARAWLELQGAWDRTVPSYLDEGIDASAAFGFVEGWTERVASDASADLDLVSAIDRFRDGLTLSLASDFPGTSVRTAFAALGANGAVLARSGAESALMEVNYGSIAKVEALDLAVEAFGPAAVRELLLPPGGCVRWIWATKDERRLRPASWCPEDVAPATHPMSFDEAVARSVNSMTARHAMLLPALLAQRRPDLLLQVSAEVPAPERAALDSPADRALSGGLLAQLGESVPPDEIAPELSYSASSVALFRYLKARREQAGLPAQRLPDDPTSLLGNSSRATAEQVGAYLHRKLFAKDGSCVLSDTGALLALHRREGTLRWLAQRFPKLVFAGKTGSSPHDDSAVAAVGLCLDARPVVLVAALRPIEGHLPMGLHGSVLLRGIDAYLRELKRLQRQAGSALLPEWAQEPEPALTAQVKP
ncbi:MAG TPA: transglycosylase domain-containing protein [Myxococcales bacterium]